jgi:DNA polymerase III subunit epsilon
MARAEAEEPPQGSPWDDPIDEAPLVFLDLEMTGLRPASDRVIEVCAVRARGERVEASLTTLVRPEDGSFGNAHVHGIQKADLAGAPTFAEIAGELVALLDGGIIVAHAATWDITFLEAELTRAGWKPAATASGGAASRFPFFLDTLVLSRRAFALPSHALGALSASLGIAHTRAHRAEDDVFVLREVFRRVRTALVPGTPRDLWHVRIGQRYARPDIVAAAVRAGEIGAPVRVRYRPAHRGPEDLLFCVTNVRTDLDPPRVLGYLLPSRGQRELRADRILCIDPAPQGSDEPRKS